MTIHSLYFLIYAALLTTIALFLATVYISNYRKNGSPINYTLIGAVAAAAMAMWTGMAATEYAYNPNAITGGLTLACTVAWASIGIAGVLAVYKKQKLA